MSSNASVDFRNRLSITNDLIDGLPDFVHFHQIFDARIVEGIAFRQRGFTVAAEWTIWIDRGRDCAETWAGFRDKTRNLIRRAGEQLSVKNVEDPSIFCSFYDQNLSGRQHKNMYGSDLMLRLLARSRRGSRDVY